MNNDVASVTRVSSTGPYGKKVTSKNRKSK